MPAKKKSARDQANMWVRFLEVVELDRIVLTSVHAERSWNLNEGTLEPEWDSESELLHWEPGRVVVGFSLFVNLVQTKADECMAEYEINYLLEYSYKPKRGFPRKMAEALADMIAPYHAWPFMREKLMALSVEMELPPLVIPVMILGTEAYEHSIKAGPHKTQRRRKRRVKKTL